MASINISGSCTITKNGVTSTLTGNYIADVDNVVELSRDIDTTYQKVLGVSNGMPFALIVNRGSVDLLYSVLPLGGSEYFAGAVPPGGHALLPCALFTDAAAAAGTELQIRTATGTGSCFVMYGIKSA